MRVNPLNCNGCNKYQDNENWALHNKSKGFFASCFSVGSTVSGFIKTCSSKDSKIYKVSNFLEKVFYAVSNCLQYFLFGRKDDVLGDDEEKKPIAAKIGKAATFQEKYVNPILKPASVLLDTNQQDGLNDALNFFDSFYWKIRFACEKINWGHFKLVPNKIKELLNQEASLDEKDEITSFIGKISAPFFGRIGTFCIGIFTPIKSYLEFFGKESKIVNCLAYLGKAAINIPYFFKFTLPFLWKALTTNDKKDHAIFAIGAVSNAMNIALPLVELLPRENNFINKFCEVYKSLTSNLSMLFFPLRRNHLGDNWLQRNLESEMSPI